MILPDRCVCIRRQWSLETVSTAPGPDPPAAPDACKTLQRPNARSRHSRPHGSPGRTPAAPVKTNQLVTMSVNETHTDVSVRTDLKQVLQRPRLQLLLRAEALKAGAQQTCEHQWPTQTSWHITSCTFIRCRNVFLKCPYYHFIQLTDFSRLIMFTHQTAFPSRPNNWLE